MLPVVYFFERARTLTPHLRETYGFAEIAEEGRWRWYKDRTVSGLLARRHKGELCGFLAEDPDDYAWTRVATPTAANELKGAVWIGIHKKAAPEHFQREGVRGYNVTLGDGRGWLIPVLNITSENLCVPRNEALIDNVWTPIAHHKCRDLCETAMEMAGQFRSVALGQSETLPTDDEMRDLMASAISINYDLTVQEAGCLSLFSPDCYSDVTKAVIDWNATIELMHLLKEMQEGDGGNLNPSEAATDGSNTSSGEPERYQLTGLPAPIPGSYPENDNEEN